MATFEKTTDRKTVRSWQVVLCTFLGFILLAALALIAKSLLNAPAEANHKIVQERLEKLAKLREEEHQTVTSYSWVDKQAGVVRIPVEQAMTLTLKELQAKPVQKSNVPVAPVVPAAAPAPAQAPAPGDKK